MTPEQYKTARLENIRNQIAFLDCQHIKKEIRYRLASNGAKMFTFQCTKCGEVESKWIPHKEVFDKDSVKPIDDGLRLFNQDLKSTYLQELTKIEHEIKRDGFFTDHDEYLKSNTWREKRRLVLDRCNGICEGCRKSQALHVHHLTYDHWKNEFLFELVGLCPACHSQIHHKNN